MKYIHFFLNNFISYWVLETIIGFSLLMISANCCTCWSLNSKNNLTTSIDVPVNIRRGRTFRYAKKSVAKFILCHLLPFLFPIDNMYNFLLCTISLRFNSPAEDDYKYGWYSPDTDKSPLQFNSKRGHAISVIT